MELSVCQRCGHDPKDHTREEPTVTTPGIVNNRACQKCDCRYYA